MSYTRTDNQAPPASAPRIAAARTGLDRRWLVAGAALLIFVIGFAVNLTFARPRFIPTNRGGSIALTI
jgi:hypothetical protein